MIESNGVSRESRICRSERDVITAGCHQRTNDI